MCRMDKFIYRGVVILVCVNLAIALILTPVLTSMYIRMEKLERKMNERNRVSVDQSSKSSKDDSGGN